MYSSIACLVRRIRSNHSITGAPSDCPPSVRLSPDPGAWLRHERDLFGLCGLLLPISFRCPQRFALVALVADVGSLEHGARLVANETESGTSTIS